MTPRPPPRQDTPALEFRNVTKVYDGAAAGGRRALHRVSFTAPRRHTIAIVGRSGSGKSTLLNLAAGIDLPSEGTVAVGGRDLGSLSERERTLLRRDEVGMVFQFFHLLDHLSVHANVALPDLIAGAPAGDIRTRVNELLDRVGLLDRADDNVRQLSGGEMQRVAICRALLRKPKLVLADEPTGNLDDANGQTVMELMVGLSTDEGSTLLYVTHSRELAAQADAIWVLHSGALEQR